MRARDWVHVYYGPTSFQCLQNDMNWRRLKRRKADGRRATKLGETREDLRVEKKQGHNLWKTESANWEYRFRLFFGPRGVRAKPPRGESGGGSKGTRRGVRNEKKKPVPVPGGGQGGNAYSGKKHGTGSESDRGADRSCRMGDGRPGARNQRTPLQWP